MSKKEGLPLGPEIEHEVTVAGKRVTFKRRILVKDAMTFTSLCQRATSADPERMIPVLCFVIESWEFAGDPHDPAAYGDMDVIAEFNPLAQAADRYVAQRVNAANSKNS